MRIKPLLIFIAFISIFSCNDKNIKVINDQNNIQEDVINKKAKKNEKLFIENEAFNGTSFEVSNVDSIQGYFSTYYSKDVFESKIGKEIKFFPKEHHNFLLLNSKSNSFLESIHLAYSCHKPIIISPDIIWLTITQGVSIHVNSNFEKYKSRLFISDKPEEIKIFNNTFKDRPEEWENLITSFSGESKKHIKSNMNNFFVPKFSTTSHIETTVFQATMLETYEKGLKYTLVSSCGIPKITITGTLEDWKIIYSKLDSLNNFDLGYWKEELKPIIQEFINVKLGKVNKPFWQEIYKNSRYYTYSYYSGWIIKFFPYVLEMDFDNPVKGENESYNEYVYDKYIPNKYLKDKNYLFSNLESDNFPKGIAQIDIKWEKNKKTYNLDFYAGFLGIKQHKDQSLEPLISWALCNKNAKKIDINFEDFSNKLTKHFQNKPIWINKTFINTDVSALYNSKEISELKIDLENQFFINFNSRDKISVEFVVSYNNQFLNLTINSKDKTKIEFIENYFRKLNGKWTAGKKKGDNLEEIFENVKKEDIKDLYEVNTNVKITLFDKH